MPGLRFDDLTVGKAWTVASRTVTEADVGMLAGLTGDHFPLHTSDVHARTTPFGTRIAHGLLGLTFAHGLMWARTGELDDTALAFLGIREWRFLAPIRFGDTIRVRYQVVEQRPSRSHPDRGVVDFEGQRAQPGRDPRADRRKDHAHRPLTDRMAAGTY